MKFISTLVLLTAGLLPNFALTQSAPKLALVDGSVVASGISKILSTAMAQRNIDDEAWTKAFPVYTLSAYSKGVMQPIAGRYKTEVTSLVFSPLFPFAEGESYIAILNYGLSSGTSSGDVLTESKLEFQFTIPTTDAPRTFVEAIYPSIDTVPENLLRMYVYFSSPMSAGDAYKHIHLLDEKGESIERPFLIVDQELWDNDRKRFTLLFDPGRIKRGIQSNLDLGLPLHRNNSYRLIIDSLWQDERRFTLAHRYEKKITVSTLRRTRLTAAHWKIKLPEAGTMNPLVVQFENPLDHVLALKYILIRDALSEMLDGKAALIEEDRIWMFTPSKPWHPGRYSMVVSPYLEDIAGNNFNNPFDIDLSVSGRVNSEEPLRIEFIVNERAN